MTHDPSELLKLADRLDGAAKVADAKAGAHLAANEMHEHATELARADQARHFSGVARYFHSIFRKREKGVKFIAPTLAQVQEYAASEEKLRDWPAKDIETWWNHFETNGWKVGRGGTPMKNWKAAARNGCAYWRERTHTPFRKAVAKVAEKRKDPDKWREFLSYVKMAYVEHWRAQGYLRDEFDKWIAK